MAPAQRGRDVPLAPSRSTRRTCGVPTGSSVVPTWGGSWSDGPPTPRWTPPLGPARAHWLRIQADESASLAGTLMSLAERTQPVVVDVVDQRIRGVVAAIGEDFVAMHTDTDQRLLIRTAALGVVRTEPGGTIVVGDRSPLLEVTLAALLVPISADHPAVRVRTLAGTSIRGELAAAGTDVLRLRVDGDPPIPAWVPVDAIAVVTLHP